MDMLKQFMFNFDELPQMLSHVSSDPKVPQCSTTVLEQDSLSPDPQSQENVPQVAKDSNNSFPLTAADQSLYCRQQHNTTHTSTTTDVADPLPLNIHSTQSNSNSSTNLNALQCLQLSKSKCPFILLAAHEEYGMRNTAQRLRLPLWIEIPISYALSWKPCQGDSLNLPDHRAQVDQGSQIKMIQVKEMMQDNDLKNSKSKDKGSKSRSQSMDEQSHYKQDKTITRQSINVKRHIFNLIGGTEEFEERDLNIGGDC
ncbi:hypothetical protein Tco_1029688 [Tanacetum coccineum]|uniref:Uncharacterized protein n=1 Tax=Tanacetum coccineum TaxID=301880 RepID=A0ABQ5G6E3_9ASTR